MRARLVIAGAALATLNAFAAVGPNYHRPDAGEVAAAYAGATNQWKTARPQAHLPKGAWWEVFGDTELNQLEVAASANQDLKAAVARFDQARALVTVNRAGYFPRIEVNPSATRNRDSANRPIDGRSSGKGDNYYEFNLPLNLS